MINLHKMLRHNPARRNLLKWFTLGTGAFGVARTLPGVAATTQAQRGEPVGSDALWDAFCERLQRSGQQILRDAAPDDPRTRAEGYRYLTRLLRAALEQEVEFSDPLFPHFYRLSSETVKIGSDNPDNDYRNAQVDGRYNYRIRGNLGNAGYIGFSSKGGSYGKTGGLEGTGFIDTRTLQVADDGSFEIRVSQTEQPGNWLPIEENSSMIIVRQTLSDRATESPVELSIECLDAPASPRPLSLDELQPQLFAATDFVEGTARLFADWVERYQRNTNQFTREDQSVHQLAGGDPAIFYAYVYWSLREEEALLIDIPPTEAEFWNVQANNYWMESLDYRYFTIHLNMRQVEYNDDGSATLVLAHRDPGRPNWLDTTGHSVGTLLFRVINGQSPEYPTARVVSLGTG